MAEYRRFVAYIYEYTNGKKQRNTGFAKVESRNGICRLQVQLQKVPQEEDSLKVYGLVREGIWLLGIFLGQIQGTAREIHITTEEQRVGNSNYSLGQLAGIWVSGTLGRTYLTLFDDEPVDVTKLVTKLPEEKKKVEMAEEQEIIEQPEVKEKKETKSEVVSEEKSKNEENEKEEERKEEKVQKRVTEEQVFHAQEMERCQKEHIPCQKPMQCAQGSETRWECMCKRYPHFQPFPEGEMEDCLRIAPRDLGFLKQGNWCMGKNSFLIHGYYNYRHLLFGKKKDGSYILGIPGIYENQELFMANMFGFPDFMEAAGQDSDRKFGYWCRVMT